MVSYCYNRNPSTTCIRISIVKIRWSCKHLIITVGIPTPGKMVYVLKWGPGGWFNIKIPYYHVRKSHCGDKMVLRSSYIHNGISYTGKMTSLYWISAQILKLQIFMCIQSLACWFFFFFLTNYNIIFAYFIILMSRNERKCNNHFLYLDIKMMKHIKNNFTFCFGVSSVQFSTYWAR